MLYRADAMRFWQLHDGGSAASHSWQQVGGITSLPATGAHIWLCPLDADAELAKLLSEDEKARAANMQPEKKSREFELARGWLRVLLAAYVEATEPQSIRLGIAENGKPFSVDHPSLHFNLSHSHECLAVAVSRQNVGIDIEKFRPVPDWRNLAEGLFTNLVVEAIAALPAAEQDQAFLRHFTAREACLKAAGTGFSRATIMFEREFHTIAMENHSYAPAFPLPEIPGYVGQICLLTG